MNSSVLSVTKNKKKQGPETSTLHKKLKQKTLIPGMLGTESLNPSGSGPRGSVNKVGDPKANLYQPSNYLHSKID